VLIPFSLHREGMTYSYLLVKSAIYWSCMLRLISCRFCVGKDYYKILEVPYKASQDEIKAKYRQLAKLYHPDYNSAT
jgi:DnaJ-domain-containing protein 1